MTSRSKRILLQPINVIFTFLQKRTRVEIWLFENTDKRIEGRIIVRTLRTSVEGSWSLWVLLLLLLADTVSV